MRVLVTGASGFIGRNVLLRAPRDWRDRRRVPPRPPGSTRSSRGTADARARRAVRPDRRRGRRARWRAKPGRSTRACIWPPTAIRRRRRSGPPGICSSNTLALVTCLEHVRVGHFVYVSSGAVYDGLQRAGHAGDAGRAAAAVRDLEARVRALPALVRRTPAYRRQLRQRPLLRRLRTVRARSARSRRAGCAA